jgi:5-methylcytosine-specific restriction protein A
LDKHPLCADPFKVHLEIPEPATVTDHIVAHKGDRRLFWDSKNWQSLCRACNSRKAAEQEGAFGNARARRCLRDGGIASAS